MKQFSDSENTAVKDSPPGNENGNQNGDEHLPPEMKAAKDLARRYRLPFVDLLPPDRESPIDYQLFTEVPVDLMVRHQFNNGAASLVATACPAIMPLAEGEKCQGSGDRIPGASSVQDLRIRKSG